MTAEKNARQELMEKIIGMELEMFLSVRASEPAACQEHPDTFKIMRWMAHSVLPGEVLMSYLNDLQEARRTDRNFMTEKYARMENKIPKMKESRLIDEIVQVESHWLRSLTEKYPLTFKGETAGFENYLACELETYSDRTLELYHQVILEAKTAKRNLVEERYNNLFEKLGYGSIEGREEQARRETSKD